MLSSYLDLPHFYVNHVLRTLNSTAKIPSTIKEKFVTTVRLIHLFHSDQISTPPIKYIVQRGSSAFHLFCSIVNPLNKSIINIFLHYGKAPSNEHVLYKQEELYDLHFYAVVIKIQCGISFDHLNYLTSAYAVCCYEKYTDSRRSNSEVKIMGNKERYRSVAKRRSHHQTKRDMPPCQCIQSRMRRLLTMSISWAWIRMWNC